jgi:hypothetical protein
MVNFEIKKKTNKYFNKRTWNITVLLKLGTHLRTQLLVRLMVQGINSTPSPKVTQPLYDKTSVRKY